MADREDFYIEQVCARLLARFYDDLDGRNNEGVLDAFAEDGQWNRLGTTLDGRAAIAQVLADRFQDAVVLHSVTNLHFLSTSGTTARSKATVTVYVGQPTGDSGPAKGSLRAVTEAVTDYAAQDGVWKIKRHSGRALMQV